MRRPHTAVADIHAIRVQIARASEFRGYGPGSVAATGVLAFLVATCQARWIKDANQDWRSFLLIWILTAAVCLMLTTTEMVARIRTNHAGLASEMLGRAVEQAAPTLMASLLVTVVFVRFAPTALWILPGLWQILFSLGVFASRRFLPWPITAVGVWYLATGVVCIALASTHGTASPWLLGLPFGLGQLFVAGILQYQERAAEG